MRFEFEREKGAVVTLCEKKQRMFLERRDLSGVLDENMALAMCGLNGVCKCMDGRTSVGKHFAGSGLFSWHRFGEGYTLFVMQKMGLSGICTHQDCGAARIVAAERGFGEDPDDLARWWGEHAAEKLEIPYFGHVHVKCDFHPETVIVLDGTGRGHWTATCLPERMVINAKHPNRFYTAEEFSIALGIIFGESGMGKVLMEQNLPLLVLAVGDPRPGGIEVRRIVDLASGVLGSTRSVHRGHFVLRKYTPPIGAFP